MESSATRPALSVIVPVHNEQDHLVFLYRELRQVLEHTGQTWEIVFVNDGSSDDTLATLEIVRAADTRVRILDLDGNFGEAAALSAGLHAARGEVLITIDGDGQNDPADIPVLLAALATPHIAVVSGHRADRHEDPWLRLLPSRVANRLIAWITGVPAHDCGCGLKAYRRQAVPRLHLPRGMNRFLPAIFGVQPEAFAEVRTRDRPRLHGRSHYGAGRIVPVLRDVLTLPFLRRDPRHAEIGFALATASAAGAGAILLDVSRAATAACDAVAIVLGILWWNVRRFNRAQTDGAYRVRREYS